MPSTVNATACLVSLPTKENDVCQAGPYMSSPKPVKSVLASWMRPAVEAVMRALSVFYLDLEWRKLMTSTVVDSDAIETGRRRVAADSVPERYLKCERRTERRTKEWKTTLATERPRSVLREVNQTITIRCGACRLQVEQACHSQTSQNRQATRGQRLDRTNLIVSKT